jgi:dihydropteroate synthase
MKIGNKEFDFENNIYMMGILNATPDSFSDGGKFVDINLAKLQVQKMVEEGADIIDVGGESTRPGHIAVDPDEELNRVVPIIKMIKENFNTVISIDTSKALVAKAAIEAGASMVNDVWGLKRDKEMAKIIAEYNVVCCIMHNRNDSGYDDLIMDMVKDIGESVKIATEAGIKREQIIIDPGIGFAKTVEENLKVMRNLHIFTQLGYPLLLGTSRKSMIGKTLDVPVDERVEGTIATTVLGVEYGVAIFRVHDVKENKRAANMALAILGAGE